jgi:hypothetical protein
VEVTRDSAAVLSRELSADAEVAVLLKDYFRVTASAARRYVSG